MTQHDELIASLIEFRQSVQADDTMSEAGRKVLLDELIKMLQHETGSRTGEDIEDVHDMRVSIRRMRSAMRLLEPYFKQKAIAPYMRRLRKIGQTLGSVRDLDVLIADLQKYAEGLPEESVTALAPVLDKLERRRISARERLNNALDRGAYRRFVQDFAAFLTTPGKGTYKDENGVVRPMQVRHVLPEMIYRHLGTVRAYDAVIDDADLTTMHALRIEFKRLRYVVSLFGEVLGSSAADFITELKTIQDYLGRLNDLTVARERLTDLMGDLDAEIYADGRAVLQSYVEALEAEQKALREDANRVWDHFNTKKVQRQLALSVAGL